MSEQRAEERGKEGDDAGEFAPDPFEEWDLPPAESALSLPRRLARWLFVHGDRRHVVFALAGLVAAAIVLQNYLRPVELQQLLNERTTVQTLFNTLLSGVILLVSIVVSINSLVVSQEIAPVGTQHERIVGSWEFRDEVAEALDRDVTPADPGEFLTTILDAVTERLDDLEAAADECDASTRERYHGFVDETRRAIDRTKDVIDEDAFGNYEVALFGGGYDPAAYIDEARRLRRSERDYPGRVEEDLDDVIEALQYLATTRQYFKTVYYKREFSHLSRDLLYTGLPAILVQSYVIMALDTKLIAGSTLGLDHLFLFFTAAFVVSLLPFLVLTAYTLRAAVIAEDTVSAGAFVLD